jgi:hypothetical protein
MALYVLGDLHLSLAVDKPMDIFGGVWRGYMDKLREGLSILRDGDVLILCGDTSWAMSLDEAAPDFSWIDGFPGQKYLVKGNHDYWWATAKKIEAFWDGIGVKNLRLLHNNAVRFGGIAVCGTRGWFYEEERNSLQRGAHNDKILQRELGRLRASLEAGIATGAAELVCCLHYPPLYEGYRCDEIVALMNEYGVRRCYFGHLHSHAQNRVIEGLYAGIAYTLVSGDYTGFKPVSIG